MLRTVVGESRVGNRCCGAPDLSQMICNRDAGDCDLAEAVAKRIIAKGLDDAIGAILIENGKIG